MYWHSHVDGCRYWSRIFHARSSIIEQLLDMREHLVYSVQDKINHIPLTVSKFFWGPLEYKAFRDFYEPNQLSRGRENGSY